MATGSLREAGIRHISSHAALRGLAALLVVAYHLQFHAAYRLWIERASPFFERCYLLVDLFFVLSGFIISYVNRADRSDAPSADEVRSFYVLRVARLYPLHLFCLAVFVCLVALGGVAADLAGRPHPPIWTSSSIERLVAQVFLLNAWWGEGWNIPSWSVSAELVCYAIFPLLMMARRRHARVVNIAIVAPAIAFYPAIAFSSGSLDIVVGLAPLRCLAGFGLGMLVYFERERIACLSPALLSIAQVLAVAGAVAMLALPVADPLIVLPFVLLVTTTWTDRGVLPALLSSRVWRWLGDVSYSIYLTHVPLMFAAKIVWSKLAPALPPEPSVQRVGWILFCYLLVLAVSALTYKLVERPARQWVARRLLGRPAAPIANAAPAP